MTSVLTSILEVFSSVGDWIATAVTDLIPMFYGAEGLTFLGVLAVAGLAFSVIFLDCTGHFISDYEYESSLTAGKS